MLDGVMAAALRRSALFVLPVLLSACAVVTAPGFDYADVSLRRSVTLGPAAPTDASDPPEGVIIPITPALIMAQRQARPNVVPEDVKRLFSRPAPYTIGPSDILGVLVYDHPELMPGSGGVVLGSADPTGISPAAGFTVGPDGQIAYPFIGRLRVEGLNETEAAELIQRRLAQFIRNPQVSVRVASYRSRRAYIDGEVRVPGSQVFTDVPMTLPEVLNRAGGINTAGDRSFITLTRNDRTTLINLMQLQELGVNPTQIMVQSGDMISVKNREENKVYVLGEIARPSALLMRNGRLSLTEALGEAGGPNLATSNASQIYVIRAGAEGKPVIYHLNARSPTALALADSFSLRSHDVVYIDPVPLVSWNRVLSLILPSANAANLGKDILNLP
jgi:polysaccharide export outer membrane protein